MLLRQCPSVLLSCLLSHSDRQYLAQVHKTYDTGDAPVKHLEELTGKLNIA